MTQEEPHPWEVVADADGIVVAEFETRERAEEHKEWADEQMEQTHTVRKNAL